MVKIAVIGTGVVGLSTAVCIQQKHPYARITLFGEAQSPNTTGDGAAGLWHPYLCGDTAPDKIMKWSGQTYEHFLNLWKSPEGGEIGVTLMPCYKVSQVSNDLTEPEWKDAVFGFQNLSHGELKLLNKPGVNSFGEGYVFTTFICECGKYLPALMKRFQQHGGTFIQRRIHSLHELGSEFDIVVNCTGIGAHELARDSSVYPIRGQIIRVQAPWLHHTIVDESGGGYIIPNQDRVILGGTHQEHDWNRKPSDTDRRFIYGACCNMVPSLKNAPKVDDFVGLRPARPEVRLEMEIVKSGSFRHRKPLIVIHNYGHGGSGITMSWGCALEVSELVGTGLRMVENEYDGQHPRWQSKL